MIRGILVSIVLALGLTACAEHYGGVKPNPYGNWRDPEYVPNLSQRSNLNAGFYPGEGTTNTTQAKLAEFRSRNFGIISEIEEKLASNSTLWCLDQPVSSCVAALAREFVVLTNGNYIIEPMPTDLLGKPLLNRLITSLDVVPPFVGKAPYGHYAVSIHSDPETGKVTSVSMRGVNSYPVRLYRNPQIYRDMKLQQFLEVVAPPICKFASEEDFFRFLSIQVFDLKMSEERLWVHDNDVTRTSSGLHSVGRCGQFYTYMRSDGTSARYGTIDTGEIGVRVPYPLERNHR